MTTFVDRSTTVTASWLNAVDAIITDPAVAAIAGVTPSADTFPYFTGAGAAALASLTSYARTVLQANDAPSARLALDAQGVTAALTAIASLTPAADTLPYFTGATTGASATLTAAGRGVLAAATYGDIATLISAVSSINPTFTVGMTLSGAQFRIRGDFSNATVPDRTAFVTTTTDGSTAVTAAPNGTSVVSSFLAVASSPMTNTAYGQMRIEQGVDMRFSSGILGTATYVPMTFVTGGVERVRIDTVGNLGLGGAAPSWDPAIGRIISFGAAGAGHIRGDAASKLIEMGANVYYESGAFKYQTTGAAAGIFYYYAPNGTFVWQGAPVNAGAAGATATLSAKMTLDSINGNLGVGADPIVRLQSAVPANSNGMTLNAATGIGLGVTDTTGVYGLFSGVASSGNAWLQVGRVSGGATAYDLVLQGAGGKVGIGAAPSYNLNLVTAGGNPEFRISDGTDQFQLYVGTGSSHTVIGTVGAQDLVFRTNATERERIFNDGRIAFKSIHNNANGAAGTTYQFLASGTYTPTITANANSSSPTGATGMWTRVGNIVTVTLSFSITITTASVGTSFYISFPIASAITAASQCIGVVNYGQGGGYVTDDAANDRAKGFLVPPTNGSQFFSATFQYEVL